MLFIHILPILSISVPKSLGHYKQLLQEGGSLFPGFRVRDVALCIDGKESAGVAVRVPDVVETVGDAAVLDNEVQITPAFEEDTVITALFPFPYKPFDGLLVKDHVFYGPLKVAVAFAGNGLHSGGGNSIADVPVIDLFDRQQAFLDKPLENRVGHAQGEPDDLRQVPLAYG